MATPDRNDILETLLALRAHEEDRELLARSLPMPQTGVETLVQKLSRFESIDEAAEILFCLSEIQLHAARAIFRDHVPGARWQEFLHDFDHVADRVWTQRILDQIRAGKRYFVDAAGGCVSRWTAF